MSGAQQQTLKAGFIGLGFIGGPMATRLPQAGFETWVYDISAEAMAPLLEAGAHGADSAAAVAANTDVIFDKWASVSASLFH